MSKYDPLGRYLDAQQDAVRSMTFGEIERLLGTSLPQSARRHRAWWANATKGGHCQAQAWTGRGWHVRQVDVRSGQVEFAREDDHGFLDNVGSSDLVDRAAALTGVNDRRTLLNQALNALLERETIDRLARLGGTMPDASAPGRRQPS